MDLTEFAALVPWPRPKSDFSDSADRPVVAASSVAVTMQVNDDLGNALCRVQCCTCTRDDAMAVGDDHSRSVACSSAGQHQEVVFASRTPR